MEKLLHECVDCIARAEGEGNASTDECNILLSIPCNKLFIIIEVCVEQSIHLFSTSNVLLRRETVVTSLHDSVVIHSTSGSDIHDGRAEVVFFYSVYRFFSGDWSHDTSEYS